MNTSDKLDQLISLMNQQYKGVFIPISRLYNNKEEFIQAIKYLIDFENKPYEFNNDYTEIRRYATTTSIRNARAKQLQRKSK